MVEKFRQYVRDWWARAEAFEAKPVDAARAAEKDKIVRSNYALKSRIESIPSLGNVFSDSVDGIIIPVALIAGSVGAAVTAGIWASDRAMQRAHDETMVSEHGILPKRSLTDVAHKALQIAPYVAVAYAVVQVAAFLRDTQRD